MRGATGASAPFFSPDGQWVAFGAPGGLKRVRLSGGDPELVCATGTTNFRGGAWDTDDRIVFTTVIGLMEVRAFGGECRVIATTDRANRESFFARPQILPGVGILLTTTTVSDDVDGSSVEVLAADGTRRTVLRGARDGRVLADHFLWLFSFGQRTLTPVWPERDAHSPVWSPNGRRLAFQAGTDGTRLGARIGFKDVDSAKPAEIWNDVQSDGRVSPASWSPDGHSLAFVVQSPATGLDIGILDLASREHRVLLGSRAQETRPAYSPDGRWLAYQSDESGRSEVFVTDVATQAFKRQVSASGGVDPVWARDGRELFFLRGSTMMAAGVVRGETIGFQAPVALFGDVETSPQFASYSVAPDGRFLLRSSPPRHNGPSNHVTLVLNWVEELRRLVPSR